MKEITLILLQILFIIIVFSSSFLQLNKKITINTLGFFEKTSMNIILILNIILFLSFINIDLKILYSSFFFLNFSLFIINKIKNYTIYKFNIYILLLIFFTFIISIDLANNLYFGWDAKFFWYLKSFNFYVNQHCLDIFQDVSDLPKYVWLMESRNIIPEIYKFFEDNKEFSASRCDGIFTCDKKLSQNNGFFYSITNAALWVQD